MKMGLAVDFHGREGFPDWKSIKAQALLAEEMGFDIVVIPDHLLYHQENGKHIGAWESVSMAGALAETTDSIRIGHSMFNTPYRPPALMAKIAESLDEISGGRYILGLGAGNTPDAEYAAFGIDADPRYSRFAESLHIIHTLLKKGQVDYQGTYWSAQEAHMVLRGPRPQGPPIMIAAHSPKMMRLAAQYADAWNGWVMKPTLDIFQAMVDDQKKACLEMDRDPDTLRLTLDLNIDHTGYYAEHRSGSPMEPIQGTTKEIASEILSYQEIGIDEVRCYFYAENTRNAKLKAISDMGDIMQRVKQG